MRKLRSMEDNEAELERALERNRQAASRVKQLMNKSGGG